MKTKTFLLLCLLLGIGLTQLSAQNGQNGTGTVTSDFTNVYWWSPVLCNGVLIDFMEGSGDVHFVDHYKDGVWQWGHATYKNGVGISDWTGETFTFKELDKTFYSKSKDMWEWTVSTHIKGDKGALYNISFDFIWVDNNWQMSVKNATCTGNSGY